MLYRHLLQKRTPTKIALVQICSKTISKTSFLSTRMQGRTGPEWKIDRKELQIHHSSQTDYEIFSAQLSAMESKIELVANAMVGLKLRIEGFDAEFERLKRKESTTELTSRDLRQLTDQLVQAKIQLEETASIMRDSQSPSPTLKIAKGNSEGEFAEVVQVNQPRQSWWQRVLA
jgi:hypothetical protein